MGDIKKSAPKKVKWIYKEWDGYPTSYESDVPWLPGISETIFTKKYVRCAVEVPNSDGEREIREQGSVVRVAPEEMPEGMMTYHELWDAIDRLHAHEQGSCSCTGATNDHSLREKVEGTLRALLIEDEVKHRAILVRLVREQLTPDQEHQGYSVEDAYRYMRFLQEELGAF